MKYYKNKNNQIFAFDDNCDEKYINKNFVEITESEAIELTKPILTDDVIKANNESKRQQLLNEANEKIAVLQDSIDLSMQEPNTDEQLKQWKKYRILLTHVDTSDINAVFPSKPE